MRPAYLFAAAALVAVVQIGFLASTILGRAAILRDGQTIELLVEPVDPRDLFRGDYVRLGTNISRIERDLVQIPQQPVTDGSPYEVTVRLSPDAEGIWQPRALFYGTPPSADAGTVDLRGTTWSAPDRDRGVISVEYGIERYYVPEGQGRPIEDGLGQRRFTLQVAVSATGTPQIKALYDDGVLVYAEPLY